MRTLADINKELNQARSDVNLWSEDVSVSAAVEQRIKDLKKEKFEHPEFKQAQEDAAHRRSERLLQMWR